MTTTTRDTRTAAQAYDENAAAITAALNHLANGLAKHRREAQAAPRDWSLTGDLSYVLDLVTQAALFINGEEE